MGNLQTQPSPSLVKVVPDDDMYEGIKDLFTRISEDVASGNEGDIIDMQCKILSDADYPHPWMTESSPSTQFDSMPGPLQNKSKSLNEDLYINFDRDNILDEAMFAESLKMERSHSEDEAFYKRFDDDKGADSLKKMDKETKKEYETIMKLVE